jgi:hypothetical protein
VIPDLAVCAFAIPAEVAVRDCVDGKVLKAPEQTVLFGNHDLVPKDFDRDKLFVRIEKICSCFLPLTGACGLFPHRRRAV